MRQLISVSLLLFSLSFSSCKTDFDVKATYKDIPVVFGLLNISDTIQWMRINKAFLGDGNAYVMAQNPDSINYPDILDVGLEEYYADNFLRRINLIRDESRIKEPGIFANVPNILYRTLSGDKILGRNTYKLVIHNRQTDSVITATSVVVDSFYIESPLADNTFKINWVSHLKIDVPVKWSVVPEGNVYQLVIRFHYREELISNPNLFTEKYIDWIFPEKVISQNGQASSLLENIEGEDFYYFVAGTVHSDNTVKRSIGLLDFIITSGAKEFYTYIQVNGVPTGITQHIPQYTNVSGGIGMFSSRIIQQVKNKEMTSESRDTLKFGSVTGNLDFY